MKPNHHMENNPYQRGKDEKTSVKVNKRDGTHQLVTKTYLQIGNNTSVLCSTTGTFGQSPSELPPPAAQDLTNPDQPTNLGRGGHCKLYAQ